MHGYSPPYVIMLSSQDSNPPSSNSDCLAQQPGGSSNFFDSLKSFVHRPLSRSRSPRRSRSNNNPISDVSIVCDIGDPTQTRPSESKPRVLPRIRHKRSRAETSSIHDYLTLEQLEAIWRQQDTRIELLDRDRNADQFVNPSASHRGRQPRPPPSTETHSAIRPRHLCSHTQTNTHGGWHRIPVSAA